MRLHHTFSVTPYPHLFLWLRPEHQNCWHLIVTIRSLAAAVTRRTDRCTQIWMTEHFHKCIDDLRNSALQHDIARQHRPNSSVTEHLLDINHVTQLTTNKRIPCVVASQRTCDFERHWRRYLLHVESFSSVQLNLWPWTSVLRGFNQ